MVSYCWATSVENVMKIGKWMENPRLIWRLLDTTTYLKMLLSCQRINEPTQITKEGNSMEITEQFEEPMYFNITEEHPMSWNTYITIC